MVDVHVIFESGEEIDILTADSCIERDFENARQMYGKIKNYTVTRY